MKTTKFIALTTLLIAVCAFAVAQAQDHPEKQEHPDHHDNANGEHPHHADNVLEAARNAGGFEIFLKAVEAAGVTENLEGKGSFTVFAPTDEAFARLPEGMLENLLEPANRAQLAGLLANHVVPGKLMAADIKTMQATNINGQNLDLRVIGGVATVSGSRIIRPDLAADNGVLHGIKLVIRSIEPVERAKRKPLDHPAH